MEQSNTHLPAEVVEQIATQGEIFANKYLNGKVNTCEFALLEDAWVAGATESAQLLFEVFQKHESGLLPDRFVYEKIKKFLYGE
jgi:hypothetical protein